MNLTISSMSSLVRPLMIIAPSWSSGVTVMSPEGIGCCAIALGLPVSGGCVGSGAGACAAAWTTAVPATGRWVVGPPSSSGS